MERARDISKCTMNAHHHSNDAYGLLVSWKRKPCAARFLLCSGRYETVGSRSPGPQARGVGGLPEAPKSAGLACGVTRALPTLSKLSLRQRGGDRTRRSLGLIRATGFPGLGLSLSRSRCELWKPAKPQLSPQRWEKARSPVAQLCGCYRALFMAVLLTAFLSAWARL